MLPGRSNNQSPTSQFWYEPVGAASLSGVDVTLNKAMAVSAVYACNRVRRESLASLPWKVFKTTGPDEEETARDYYLWKVLHDRPNRWQTPFEFKEMAVTHIDFRGNFYCQILGVGDGMELIPLNPDRMEVKQRDDLRLEYKYREASGRVTELREEDVYHVRGLTHDGVIGVGVLEYARNVIGSSIAQETHGASLFKNGGLNPLWISRPSDKPWTPEARENFSKNWRRLNSLANVGVPSILLDGMELHELGLTNRDSQWIEARGFTAEEICRFFGVPPYMIGINAGASYGSVEQQGLEFVNYTLGPLVNRFEQAADRDLVGDDGYHTKIILDALLRGDTMSRFQAHNIAVQGGWKTKNEVRKVEGLNPMEGGDDLQQALNMQPAGGGPDQNEQGGQPGKGTPKKKQQEPQEEDSEPSEFEKRKQKKKEARGVFSVFLSDAANRIASAEIAALNARASKASDDHAKWCDWAEGVYVKHNKYVATVLSPLCAAFELQTGERLSAQKISDRPLRSSEVFDAGVDVCGVLDKWESCRADEMFSYLMEIFFGDDQCNTKTS